jgi:hypothetical protein
VDQLGPNALGQVLELGRVPDCYFGLMLSPGAVGEAEAGTILIVGPAPCCTPQFPSRPAAWSMSCSLATANESPASWYSWPT